MSKPANIAKLQQQLRELLMHGYANGGSFAHGDAVRLLKAQIIIAKEEKRFFG